MSEPFFDCANFELDLSFVAPSQELLEGLADQTSTFVFAETVFWETHLKGWIQFIRSERTLLCPELVRISPVLSMGLQFTDDPNITVLNSSWCNKAETTDVLSFPAFDEKMISPLDQSIELGDIVVSLSTAERQAQEFKHSLVNELRWLVSHGLLHLLGWDHPNDESLKEMLLCQEQLLLVGGNL